MGYIILMDEIVSAEAVGKSHPFSFSVRHRERGNAARVGLLTTPRGAVLTPAFIPVGTAAAVKTLAPDELRAAGVQIVLGNTYHLRHQPGPEIIAAMGGFAHFMAWDGPTLTDSGGFQVFSLSATRKVVEEGVVFQSVYDGRSVRLTPEDVCRTEWAIGADIIYALDECPPYPAPRDEVVRATDLTVRWAGRFLSTFRELAAGSDGSDRAPFLVIQGGLFEDVRRSCIERLAFLDPAGFGIGGVSVGEPPPEMLRVAQICCQLLPPDKPRHLLGVGTPADLLGAIAAGVDLFDCVLPTRNGRNGQAFTSRGVVNLRHIRWKSENGPLDESCDCPACKTFSLAYLHHLTIAGEMLGMRLLSLHNVAYYEALLRGAREAIGLRRYDRWRRVVHQGWEEEERKAES